MAVQFTDYVQLHQDLEQTLRDLTALQPEKIAAVRAHDLEVLNDCMKREQAASLAPAGPGTEARQYGKGTGRRRRTHPTGGGPLPGILPRRVEPRSGVPYPTGTGAAQRPGRRPGGGGIRSAAGQRRTGTAGSRYRSRGRRTTRRTPPEPCGPTSGLEEEPSMNGTFRRLWRGTAGHLCSSVGFGRYRQQHHQHQHRGLYPPAFGSGELKLFGIG